MTETISGFPLKTSSFKTEEAKQQTSAWIDAAIERSALDYEKLDISTSFGTTRVLAFNHARKQHQPLVYVPGARTCGIFLDLSNQLHTLSSNHRIYLLDVVGQIGLSDGTCPSLKDGSYGVWLREVCDALEVNKGVFVGASFGGQILLKFAAVAPERIEKAILLNPIGFSNISFAPTKFYQTIAPVINPTRKNVDRFLARIVFAPHDGVSADTKTRVADFVENAVQNFKFAGEYPSRMSDAELRAVTSEIHLIVGARDGLIPHQKTLSRAQSVLPQLKSSHICPKQAHGIEVSGEAIEHLHRIMQSAPA